MKYSLKFITRYMDFFNVVESYVLDCVFCVYVRVLKLKT